MSGRRNEAAKAVTITRRASACSRITARDERGAALVEVDVRCDRAGSAHVSVTLDLARLRRWVRLDAVVGLGRLPDPEIP